MPTTAVPGIIPSLLQSASRESGNVLCKLPFHIYPVHACVRNELHWHDYTQIWYTVSGSYYHTINGERRLQTPGSIALVYPYTLHAVDTSETDISSARIISISLRNDVYEKNQLSFLPLTYSLAVFNGAALSQFMDFKDEKKELADKFCEAALDEYSRQNAMIQSKIFSCIDSLLALCIEVANRPLQSREIKLAYERASHINDAVRYITDNSMSKIPLSKASSIAMMSERSFTNKFKQVVGQTYHNYLINLRMAKAADLLRFSNKSISEISDECGFSNCGHLTNICNATFNMSPMALRKYFREWNMQYEEYLYKRTLDLSWLYNWTDEELSEIRRTNCGDF